MSDTSEVTSITPSEIFRFFSPRAKRLVSVKSNGIVMTQGLGEEWRPSKHLVRPMDMPVEEFIQKMKARAATLPAWALRITDLPTMAELEEWMREDVAYTTDGDEIEPDGVGYGGAPSWFIALGFI
jgi:hypothetical protein